MKRSRFSSRRSKQTPNADQLIRLATYIEQSGGRLEADFWAVRLSRLVEKLLTDGAESALDTALDHLYGVSGPAYDYLADAIEFACEVRRIEAKPGSAGQLAQDVQLIALPLLAWSRFGIPTGLVAPEILSPIRTHLCAHVLAQDTKLALINYLYSPDQMPESFQETWLLAEKLVPCALNNRDLFMERTHTTETIPLLSDVRYLIAGVAVSRGEPLFRWQEKEGNRVEALKQWRLQGGEVMRPLLPACAIELQLPQAFHAATRDADHASRPYALRAAVAYLQTTLHHAATGLRAVIASFYDRQLDEYRISFTLGSSPDVVHGVVWPLLDTEDESTDVVAQIEAVLKESGVQNILMMDQRFPIEYCDDCGAPLFINPDGEAVHAELPEEEFEVATRHLH
jgi:hypothetical protein